MASKKLLEAFKEFGERCESYYEISIKPDELFEDDNDGSNCREFIQKHFEKGSKQEALNFPFADEYITEGKHKHTVSLYLLGLTLEDIFSDLLKKTLEEKIPGIDDDWYDFKYTWYLTCLYHDAASYIEDKFTKEQLTCDQKQLQYYLDNWNIEHTPYSYKPSKDGVCLTSFPVDLIKNYFYYRAKTGKIEHGIIGGYWLFNKLYNNFQSKTKDVDWDAEPIVAIEKVNWRKEHIDHYAYISDAIICHNIWRAYEKDDKCNYRKFGLSPLIINNDKDKLAIRDNPLQFILCLLDTIEPVKRFSPNITKEVLNSISIIADKNENNNNIQIKIDYKAFRDQNGEDFIKWKDGIREMNKWLNVRVCEEGEILCIDVNINP